jgi:KDO2-lipid IV(A) lauroyltransferase
MSNPIRRRYKASPRLRRLSRKAKNAAIGGGTQLALALVGLLSLERALWLADRSGALLYRVLGDTRRLALEHLHVAFGDTLAPAARTELARAALVNAARCFCEIAKIDTVRAQCDTYFTVDGEEHLRAMLAQGKGAIVITGHIGNWELLAAYFAWHGYPVAAIARRIYAEGLNDLLVDYRRRQGVETILRESSSSSRQLIRALKDNRILAMLIDQDTHVPSVSVPFFGRLARTPSGPATLAIRRGLPVCAAFIERRPAGGHRITVHPVTVQASGDSTADVYALTQAFSAALEAQIRSHPAEWVWWHRRWHRAPIPELDLDANIQYTDPNTATPAPRI